MAGKAGNPLMKITRRRLKQIIKEELLKLQEYGGRPYDPTHPGDITPTLGISSRGMGSIDDISDVEPFVTSSLGPEVQWDPSMDRPTRAGTYRTSGGPQFRDWEDAGDLQRADAAQPRTAPSMGTGTSTSNAARRGRNVRRALGTAGRGARFLARQLPLVGTAMTIPSVARGEVHPLQWAAEQAPFLGPAMELAQVARGEVHPLQWAAEQVPFLGTAMELAQAAEEARPERRQEYERSYRTAMENPASRPFTIASQPPPRAMGTADTQDTMRSQRRVGPEGGGGQAAWKRDDLNEQHIQQIIEEELAQVIWNQN